LHGHSFTLTVDGSHLSERVHGAVHAKTWLKHISVDIDTTAADALQRAADRPTWRAVATAARLRAQ